MRRRLTEGIRPGASIASDDVLLASLGIDVAEVRRRAAEVFGSDAVQRGSDEGSRRRASASRPVASPPVRARAALRDGARG